LFLFGFVVWFLAAISHLRERERPARLLLPLPLPLPLAPRTENENNRQQRPRPARVQCSADAARYGMRGMCTGCAPGHVPMHMPCMCELSRVRKARITRMRLRK
jgi:hypothetical protein